jgi:two-component system NtrC family sensor kinase
MWIGWLVAVVAIAVAAWMFQRLRNSQAEVTHLLGEQASADEQIRKLQSTQSQVIHTTKLASLGQMVAGVAHEINTPLGFVKSNVEVVSELLDDYKKLVKAYDAAVQYCLQPVELILGADKASLDKLVQHVEGARRKLFEARANLEKSPLLPESKDLLKDSSEGLTQLASLVQNLKSFSRVDRDGLDWMDVNEGLDSALMIASHELRDRIEIVRQFGQLPKIHCMPAQINQVFLNLITNAAQAIDGNGTLTVETKPADGRMVEVQISDTGKGIGDDVLPKIFDPFFTTKPVGQGTGLGLSIVHKIVRNHGGSIKVRTAPGKGATFIVMLPVEASVPAANGEELAAA